MKIEFNKGKIEEKEEKKDEIKDEVKEEIEEEIDYQEEKKEKKSFIRQNDLKKPLLKIAIIITAILGLLLILSLIIRLITPKTKTFEEIESIMANAAKSYFSERKNYLPENVGDVVEVDVANLVAAEKMKDLSEYTDENTVCSGRVEVEKTEDSYVYSPYLDCGDSYETIELYKKVEKDNPTVSSGYGLYAESGNYIFKGETVNNYLKLGNTIWRIVKINSDNTTTLIENDRAKVETEYSSTSFPWDDRYNIEKENNYGINNFGPSRIHEIIQGIYNEKYEQEVKIITKEDREKFAPYDLCIGKRSESDTTKDNSTECLTRLENKYVGLLTASDYMNASLDTNCTNTISESCQNYNYLNSEYPYWLMTASSDLSYYVYAAGGYDAIYKSKASSKNSIRLVVRLKNNVFYKSGTGTEEDPYIVK